MHKLEVKLSKNIVYNYIIIIINYNYNINYLKWYAIVTPHTVEPSDCITSAKYIKMFYTANPKVGIVTLH